MLFVFILAIVLVLVHHVLKMKDLPLVNEIFTFIFFVLVPSVYSYYGNSIDFISLLFISTAGLLVNVKEEDIFKKIFILLSFLMHELLYLENTFLIFLTLYLVVFYRKEKNIVLKPLLLVVGFYTAEPVITFTSLVLYLLVSLFEQGEDAEDHYLYTLVPVTILVLIKGINYGNYQSVFIPIAYISLFVAYLTTTKKNYLGNISILANVFLLCFSTQNNLIFFNILIVVFYHLRRLIITLFENIEAISDYKEQADLVLGIFPSSPLFLFLLYSMGSSDYSWHSFFILFGLLVLPIFYRDYYENFKEPKVYYSTLLVSTIGLLVIFPFAGFSYSWIGLESLIMRNTSTYTWSNNATFFLVGFIFIVALIEFLKIRFEDIYRNLSFKKNFKSEDYVKRFLNGFYKIERNDFIRFEGGVVKYLIYGVSDLFKIGSSLVVENIVVGVWGIVLFLVIMLVYSI